MSEDLHKFVLSRARRCLELEVAAIEDTSSALGDEFVQVLNAVQRTVGSHKKLVFSGMGKNVHICEKLVGTFNSTGIPTLFLNPNQALHGDLGLCEEGDLALFFSNSGQTEDLLRLLPLVKRLGLKVVGVSSNPDSTLARECDFPLSYVVKEEACPLKLAPTASTTTALALGDALAMVSLELRGFTREDFARYHPAGALGQQLLLKVGDIMRTGDRYACLPDTCNVQDALLAITSARCGTIALTDPKSGVITGVFSDGDFRRASLNSSQVLREPVQAYMTRSPITIQAEVLAVEALRIFEKRKINDLIVVDDQNCPIGLLDGQDLPRLHLL